MYIYRKPTIMTPNVYAAAAAAAAAGTKNTKHVNLSEFDKQWRGR